MIVESKIEDRSTEARNRSPKSKRADSLPAKDDIDAAENQVKLSFGQLSDFAAKQNAIEANNLRNIGDRVFWKPRGSRGKQDIAGRIRPSEIAGQRHADNGSDPASVEGISLDYNHRPSKPRTGTGWRRQVRPVDVTLGDYHSTRLRVRLATAEMAGSGRVSTASHTRFIASVTASGSWRARYSATASAYIWLRDFLRRRDRCSASVYSLSGIDMAVFIPGV